jgi:hypothetical protein
MQFTIALFAVVGLVSAVAVEDAHMTAIRRDSLFGRQAKAITTGACCVEGVSQKEDACKDGTGAAGVCVPDNQAGCKYFSSSPLQVHICVRRLFRRMKPLTSDRHPLGNGALTCVALTKVTCNAAVIERNQPTCRRVTAGQTANGVTVARTGTGGAA